MCSFLRHGLAGTAPRAGGWSWEETQELNAGIDWAAWERGVLPSVLAAAGFSVEDGSAAAGAALKDSDVVAPSPQAGADPPVHPSLIRE